MRKNIVRKLVFILVILISTASIKAQQGKSVKYHFPKLPMIPSINMALYQVIKQDFTLTLRDNVILDCSKFYPSEPNPYLPDGYFGVIMCHGYGDRKETLEGFASAQASFGYSVYTYSMRGQGNSGGLSNLISIIEAQDLMEFVNYVKHDHNSSGVDSSKILIMGGSQGGIIPYMAACNGMNVRTIISALASPEFATSWIENGSIKMTLLWTISYTPDTARYSPQVNAMRDWVYSSAVDKWDSLAYWLPKDRDFTNMVSQNTVPIMMENSWQDYFFNAYGNIKTIPNLTSPKRYYFGAVMGHGGDTSGTENAWHENFFNEWFYYWLWNIDNGILTRPLYHYASTTFPENSVRMWSFVHDSSTVWPPAGMTNLKLYFNADGKLKTTPNANSNSYSTLNNSVSGGLTMQQAVTWEFKGSQFNSRFKKSQLTYDSPVLAADTKLLGTPSVNLDYSSNMKTSQFNYQIYEVSGTLSKLVTRINYTDRKNIVNVRKVKSVNGNSHSHIFRKGNKIRIILTNLDTSPRSDSTFLETNPFVLPVLNNGNSRLYLSSNSYINFPVLSNSTVLNPIAGIFEDEQKNEPLNSGLNQISFSLKQNYPNPFNPVTKIEYSIPNNAFVTLKIYDITGKEVAVLVNSQMSPGNYSVNFDANLYKLSSGIYFYKLTAGNETIIKKLTLIK
jgi:predicted acyl esterase